MLTKVLIASFNMRIWCAKNSNLIVIFFISTLILLASSIARHELFNSSGDLAFFDQCIYLISQGKPPISSVLGFHILADHAAWILYFIALLYKIYPTIYWLFIVQSLALASGSIPIYILSKKAGLKQNQAIIISVIYLLYPVIYNSNLCDFHPDTIAVLGILTAVLAARTRKIGWFCISILIVLGCKAVLSLTIVAMGIWLLLFEKRRLYGVTAIVSGILWFIIANKIIIPFFGNETALINRHLYRYSYLKGSFYNIVKFLFSQPYLVFKNIFSLINLEYVTLLLLPTIWSLKSKYLSPLVSILPCFLLNIIADHDSQKNLVLHYSLPIIPFLILVTIDSLKSGESWLKNKRTIFLWSLVCFLTLGKWGFFLSKYIRSVDNLPATKEAISLISTSHSILTTDIITPHLTHRELIKFNYKNYEINNFYYILINVRHPGWAKSSEDYKHLVDHLKTSPGFHLKYQKDDVFLFVQS